jgi:hypothetical protein
MNYSDLFVVLALVTGLYGLMVALARQRSFLTRSVNPYRGAWLLAGITAVWFGVGLLRLEAKSWDVEALGYVLGSLVTDRPLPTQGKVAAVALLLGLLLIVLVIWCRFNFPRDPSTFGRPGKRSRAVRYYVGLRGGLDYAVVMRPGGQVREEAWAEKQVRANLIHLPRIALANGEKAVRTPADQVAHWRAAAEKLHASMAALDGVIAPAHQGANRRLVFDCEYAGLFFAYLRPPVPGADGEAEYVFAATLSQEAMNSKVADAHFDLLVRALKLIDANVRVA